MADGPEWFAAKRYGYGAGRPISWQGWLMIGLYIAVMFGLAWALQDQSYELIAAAILPTTIFILIAARTTRGGWRWRWGDDAPDPHRRHGG